MKYKNHNMICVTIDHGLSRLILLSMNKIYRSFPFYRILVSTKQEGGNFFLEKVRGSTEAKSRVSTKMVNTLPRPSLATKPSYPKEVGGQTSFIQRKQWSLSYKSTKSVGQWLTIAYNSNGIMEPDPYGTQQVVDFQ